MRSIPISAQLERRTEVDLGQLLNTLRRGKWLILLCVLITTAAGIYYAVRMTVPLYTATSTVALEHRQRDVVDLGSPLAALEGDYLTLNTEVKKLQSRDLIEKLVRKMDLVSDPFFNPTLLPPQEAGFSIQAEIKKLIRAVLPREETEAVEQPGPPQEEIIFEDVVDTVLASIEVINLVDSYVFAISVTTTEPDASSRIANGLSQLYIEDQIAQKYEATEQATAWLNGRVAELKDDLEATENAVKAFNAETALVGPETLGALNRQLKDRRDRVATARTQAAAAAAQVDQLEQARQAGDPALMSEVADDQALRQLLPRLGETGARATFDTRFDQLVERARFEATRAGAQISALEASVRDLEGQVERQSTELVKLEQLEREAGASRQLYEYFLGRLKETSAQQGIHRADSRILSRAVLPRKPSAPNKKSIVFAAAFVGFALGVALVLVRELRQKGFRSAQDLEQATGVNVFAQIPKAPFSKRRRVLNYLATVSTSRMAEAVRNLRTSVLLSDVDKPPQVIMMTSSLPGEGKTTQSLALAQSFVGMDKRVLLIEGDIRRRMLQEYFNVRGKAGLVSAVAEEVPLEDVILHADALGIDVLIGEKSTVNAADFFASGKFQGFLEKLRRHYDVVIIDTPPVLVVPDARVIGRMVDTVIYVVKWNQTTPAQVQEGLHSLQSVDVKVAGLSLSQINLRQAQAYGGKYGELYGSYGRKYYGS